MDKFIVSMRHEIAHKGYKVGEVLGYSTFGDGEDAIVASTWEAEGRTWETTYKVRQEDVNNG